MVMNKLIRELLIYLATLCVGCVLVLVIAFISVLLNFTSMMSILFVVLLLVISVWIRVIVYEIRKNHRKILKE